MGEAKILLLAQLNIFRVDMASLLRLGSRCGGGIVAKNSSVLSRSSPNAAIVGATADVPLRNASTEEKAATKKAKEAALDKKMREKFGIISHEESLKDFTRYETLPVNTHTAEAWDKEDNKNARFVDAGKLTVKMHAIDLIAEIPPIASETRVVSCDGGGGALGHPKVFINLDKPGNHACGYCGLRFFLDHHH